jgi:hypothetical protein
MVIEGFGPFIFDRKSAQFASRGDCPPSRKALPPKDFAKRGALYLPVSYLAPALTTRQLNKTLFSLQERPKRLPRMRRRGLESGKTGLERLCKFIAEIRRYTIEED